MQIDDETRTQLCEIARKTAQDTAREAVAMYQLAEYLPRGKMSRWLGVSPGTLNKFTAMGMKCHVVGSMRLWRKQEVIEWLDQFKQ